jgi:selenoprotein W-related protein
VTETTKPSLTITYCTQCNWLLRSAWMAQEVLSTFSLEMGAVTLVPSTGGIFEIAPRWRADLGAQARWRLP